MVECPTCGRTDFKNETGMKQHHAVAHGESLSVKTVECDNCGEEFGKRADHVEKFDHHFCDEACEGEWRSDWLEGKNSPHWSRVETECHTCGKEIQVRKAKYETYKRHFCSDKCDSAWRSEYYSEPLNKVTKPCTNCGESIKRWPSGFYGEGQFCDPDCWSEWLANQMVGESNRFWDGGPITVECATCGEQKEVCRSESEKRDRHFCDKDCQGEWLSENRTGEDANRWFGGYEGYYGPSWQRQRRKALERDGHQCVVCGITSEQHVDEHGQDLHVHHITPFRKYALENHERANRLENLVTLCQPHHSQWEGLNLRPQTAPTEAMADAE